MTQEEISIFRHLGVKKRRLFLKTGGAQLVKEL
jgi:hypothetical protein